METNNGRDIIIASDKLERRIKLQNCTAKTLGELKRELDNMGIDYRNADFIEINSKLKLVDDDTQLPERVFREYTDSYTNNIAIFIQTRNKKIDSGSSKSPIKRYMLNEAMKKYGLIDDFKKNVGNYTQTSSADLYKYLESKGFLFDGEKFVPEDDTASNHEQEPVVEELKEEAKQTKENSRELPKDPVEKKSIVILPWDVYAKKVVSDLSLYGDADKKKIINYIYDSYVDDGYSDAEIRNLVNRL